MRWEIKNRKKVLPREMFSLSTGVIFFAVVLFIWSVSGSKVKKCVFHDFLQNSPEPVHFWKIRKDILQFRTLFSLNSFFCSHTAILFWLFPKSWRFREIGDRFGRNWQKFCSLFLFKFSQSFDRIAMGNFLS